MCTHMPDAGELWIHCLHVGRTNRYKGIRYNTGMSAYRGGVVTSGVGICTSSYCRHHMCSKTGTTVGYGSVPGGVFTGGVGIIIILSCVTNRTCCVCVTCTYSGVDMHPGNSHHTLMFHKYYGKHTSEQCKVTDKAGMETYIWCLHGCICPYTVNIFLSFQPSSL